MASGDHFEGNRFTAAHRSLPCSQQAPSRVRDNLPCLVAPYRASGLEMGWLSCFSAILGTIDDNWLSPVVVSALPKRRAGDSRSSGLAAFRGTHHRRDRGTAWRGGHSRAP